ncbi:PfkB family carbohydrate kinase [Fontibacter flavus]|uniref:PfkB family carbohydrate kinase n=1 Tax=Fontibacter flavus TaxID=654838 RepID=A0ABV6FQA6_9BACT
MNKKVLTIGDVMMRLSTQGNERFLQANSYNVVFGGAEANVAVSLAQWDIDAYHMTVFPDHDLGMTAIRYLRQVGVKTDHIFFGPGRLGLYFLENGAMQRPSKIIYDRFDSAFANFEGKGLDWIKMLEGVDCFHWTGITPALSQNAADMLLEALKAAKNLGVLVSGDINYRRNLWQYGKGPLDIMPELIRYTDVIVAGLTDFENCMDIIEPDYEDACRQAMKDFPQLKYITTTERNSISASHNQLQGWLWNGKEILKSKNYDMPHIVDRIGGGDAYMAGLIYGMLHFPDQTALEFATSASVLKHSIVGDANLVTKEEVLDLMKGENVGRLLR